MLSFRKLVILVLSATLLGFMLGYKGRGTTLITLSEIVTNTTSTPTPPVTVQKKEDTAVIRRLNYSKEAFCRNGRLSPSVFVIGVQKCGTTTLQGILKKFSTTINSGGTKEHHMFDHPPGGRRTDENYLKGFSPCNEFKRSLDNTPNYTNPETISATRIKEYAIRNNMPLDQILFIAMVRPNHKRLKSAFAHEAVKNPRFPAAWRQFNYTGWLHQHLKKTTANTDRMQLKSRGYYGKIFKSYFKEFPQSTFLFIESTKAFSSQQPIADALSKMLGLPKVTMDDLVWANSAKNKPDPILEHDTELVKEHFRPHELEFQKLLRDNKIRVYTIPQQDFFEDWDL
eukprot:TRINITY_DN1057_c0_g1_i3.p1 TRINITY_DN1057_c0_g1~~TRINITY_DN1057_c0_g1_i3.p1  ORF type:complete len:341 (+),score=48.08 TRINITY_DN1057_c0_g1_i3:50-1072(+)